MINSSVHFKRKFINSFPISSPIPAGTQILYLSHARVILINSPFAFRPPKRLDGMGSVPEGDSELFIVSHSCHVDQFTSQIRYRA